MWLGSNFSILPISISSLGILLTLVTITVLVRNRDTPLVRASGETRLWSGQQVESSLSFPRNIFLGGLSEDWLWVFYNSLNNLPIGINKSNCIYLVSIGVLFEVPFSLLDTLVSIKDHSEYISVSTPRLLNNIYAELLMPDLNHKLVSCHGKMLNNSQENCFDFDLNKVILRQTTQLLWKCPFFKNILMFHDEW